MKASLHQFDSAQPVQIIHIMRTLYPFDLYFSKQFLWQQQDWNFHVAAVYYTFDRFAFFSHYLCWFPLPSFMLQENMDDDFVFIVSLKRYVSLCFRVNAVCLKLFAFPLSNHNRNFCGAGKWNSVPHRKCCLKFAHLWPNVVVIVQFWYHEGTRIFCLQNHLSGPFSN